MEPILTKWEDDLCGGGVGVSSGFVVATAHLYITFRTWKLLFPYSFCRDVTELCGEPTRIHLL